MQEPSIDPWDLGLPRLRALAIAIALVLVPDSVFSTERNLRFHHYYPESGLSQTSVKCILQDGRGLLWLGTEDGLNRYDGYRFTVFRRDDRDPASLPHNYIQALLEDRRGHLWVGTRSGLARRTRGDHFERFRHVPGDPATLANDEVTALLEASNGAIWVGTRDGLSRYDPTRDVFLTFRHDSEDEGSLGGDTVLSLFEDSRKRLWIGTDGGGLSRWIPERREFRTYRHDPASAESLSDDRVSAIGEDRTGRLWIGTLGGTLDRLDDRHGGFVRHGGETAAGGLVKLGAVRSLLPDGSQDVWIGSDTGLVAFHAAESHSEVFRRDPVDGRSLSDDRVLSLHIDPADVLWVGTSNGLNKSSLRSSHFRLTQAGSGPDDLTSGVVTAIHEDENGVWVGTFGGGLSYFDDRSGRFTHYRHDPDDPTSLGGDRVMSVVIDREGTLWAGTFRGGLSRFDGDSRTFRHYVHDPGDPRSLTGNGITALREDREGNLWVAVFNGGLHRYAPASDDFVRYAHDPGDPSSLPDPRVFAIYQDRDGAIWLGTATAGIARFDPDTGTFVNYPPDPDSADSLSAAAVYTFSEDEAGNLWIGTQAGLHRWARPDREAGLPRFRRYTERDGLPNGVVYGILPDDAGRLWMSTNHGISRFDPASAVFTNYDISHGLQGREFNLGAYHRGRSGELFFGGTNGFNRFDPMRIRGNDHVPPVLITSIKKLNDPVPLIPATGDAGVLEVDHTDYVISFEFAALDFVDPEKNRYAYMLEGLDDDWIQLGNDRRATYTNLAAGDYTLRVRASNNDGLWNEEGARLGIVVFPPPWKTWWAYTLYALTAVFAAGAYVRAQRQKLLREAEYSRRLEAEVELRTRQLADANTKLADANKQLESAALTDPLTGLYNRRFLMTTIEAEVAAAERDYLGNSGDEAPSIGTKRDFAFVVLDLDGLKPVNDTFGHDAGDRAIRQTAELLRDCSRGSDSLIRLGGDEFLLVARNVTIAGAQVLASRICDRVRSHEFELGEGVVRRMSCSLGYSFYPFSHAAPTRFKTHDVIAVADRALYFSKQGGRNAYAGIHASEDAPFIELSRILEDLDSLLEQGMLKLDSSLTDVPEETGATP